MSHKKNHPVQFKRKKKVKDKILRIGAQDYTFITCDVLTNDGTDVAGLCDVGEKKIYVNTIAIGSDKETLVHEIVHAAIYEYGITQHDSWCTSLEEVVAEVMSKVLVANFRLAQKT